jgi:hypothetical protein
MRVYKFNFAGGIKFGLGFNSEPKMVAIDNDGEKEDIDGYAAYSSTDLTISVPVKCEYDFNEKFAIRVGVDLAGLYLTSTSIKADDDADAVTGTDTKAALFGTSPTLGILFRF